MSLLAEHVLLRHRDVPNIREIDVYSAHGGYDALRKEYGDMIKFGVIVPTKVERAALQNGASIASLLLTTDAVVSEIPEKKEAPPAMPPGGGMY